MQSSEYPKHFLILIFFSQSCQILGVQNYPAGTANTTFSVDSEGNVVIIYGASKSHSDNTWRYFATFIYFQTRIYD